MWDIEEGDESTASPVTTSPLATCPRVTPIDCLDRSCSSSWPCSCSYIPTNREETLDELSSGLEDDDDDDITVVALTSRGLEERLEEVMTCSRSHTELPSLQQIQV